MIKGVECRSAYTYMRVLKWVKNAKNHMMTYVKAPLPILELISLKNLDREYTPQPRNFYHFECCSADIRA